MKIHTFRITCSFNLQYSFAEREVSAAEQGRDGIAPTEDALAALQAEIAATLAEKYPISSMTVEADADDLLGSEMQTDL